MLIGCALLWGLAPGLLHAQPATAEVAQLQIERSEDALLLDAAVTFKLPHTVEDALLKGLPVIFVEEADIYRERWYWADKKVAGEQRSMRLVFQPLTRRWRLTVGSGQTSGAELGVALSQIFDTLDEALAVIRRVSGWRIAKVSDIEVGAKHRLEFRFHLDLTQLPRPLQIGALGESDWSLSASASQNLTLENPK